MSDANESLRRWAELAPFPIMKDERSQHVSQIPWWLAEEAYKEYVKQFGDQQSLEKIAERGGFGREELLRLLRHQRI